MTRNLRRTATAVVGLVALSGAILGCSGDAPKAKAERLAGATDPVVTVAVVGDANPLSSNNVTTRSGKVAVNIKNANPDAVLFVGDFQYKYGTCANQTAGFDKAGWGALMPKIIGTAGSTHDWGPNTDPSNYTQHMAGKCPNQTTGPSLAVSSWAETIGPDTPYWVDLGAWRVYSLPSAIWKFTPSKASAVTDWLRTALTDGKAAGDNPIVMWHQPYWTSGTAEHPPAEGLAQKPWVQVLDDFDVPLLLTGHQHGYERFYPQNADRTRDDAQGTQEFTVGTGGIGSYPWTGSAQNSATKSTGTYGWLKLTLQPDGAYAWSFQRVAGNSFADSGSRPEVVSSP